MGRGQDADIQVSDETCSRHHAELVLLNKKVILSDLGTKNGVFVNDKRRPQAHLKNNDRIVIGRIVYKFNDIFNEKIAEEGDETKEEEKEEEKEKEKEKEEGDAPGQPEKKKRPIVLIVAVAAVFLLLSDDEKEETSKERPLKQKKSREITGVKKKIQLNEELKRKFDMYLHRGIREYREENYFRAIAEFDMALTLNPTDGRASFYRRKSVDEVKSTIDGLFVKVKRQMEALKFGAALVSLCEVVKLLDQYEDNDKKEQAYKIIEEIQIKEGIEESESKCFKE